MDVLIANLVNASRAAGWCRGKGIDDTADNRAEDAALDALKAETTRLQAAISFWAMATYPETRPDPHDIEGRCRAQAALNLAETTLYGIFKEFHGKRSASK